MVTPRILGPDGQPIRTADLSEPQTSRVMQLRNEWAGHPSRGLTPSRLGEILIAAENNDLIAQCDLFEDMEEKDAHLASEMGKRRRALLSLEWDIVPPTSPYAVEKKTAARLKELLADVDDFEDLLFDVTDAIGKGYCNLEIEWHRLDGIWLPKSVTHRPQSWFQLFRGYRQEMRLRDNSADGAPLQPFGWISHTHRAKSGYIERAALFRVLVWPYLFKTYSVGDLAEFLEVYGLPLRVGKYPPGASEKEKMLLLRALASLGHNAAGIMPSGMEIDFQDAVSGDPDAFQLMIDWCEKSQSKAILGGTLTSQADGKTSTNALGNVHNEVRKDLRDADAKQIAKTLTRDLMYPIAALNGLTDNIRRGPRFRFVTEETEDMKLYSEALPKFVSMGMKVPRKWAQERLGIPEPEADDDDLLVTSAAPADPEAPVEPAAKAAETRRRIAALTASLAAQEGADVTPIDAQAEALTAQAAPAWSAILDRVRDLVDAAPDMAALRDALLGAFADLPQEALTEVMAMGMAAAELAGRYDQVQESRG